MIQSDITSSTTILTAQPIQSCLKIYALWQSILLTIPTCINHWCSLRFQHSILQQTVDTEYFCLKNKQNRLHRGYDIWADV